MTRLRMLLRIAAGLLDVLRRPRAYRRLAPAILALVALGVECRRYSIQ